MKPTKQISVIAADHGIFRGLVHYAIVIRTPVQSATVHAAFERASGGMLLKNVDAVCLGWLGKGAPYVMTVLDPRNGYKPVASVSGTVPKDGRAYFKPGKITLEPQPAGTRGRSE